MATQRLDALLDRMALRRRLLSLRPFRALHDHAAASRRAAFVPAMLGDDFTLSLQRSGFAEVAGFSALGGAHGARIVSDLIAGGAAAWQWPENGGTLEPPDVCRQGPAVYRIGLIPALLDRIEAHLGEPCLYGGAVLKLERATGTVTGNRMWHFDVEDRRMVRVIVYLNDVAPGGGPFSYIDRVHSSAAAQAAHYRGGYLDDGQMRGIVPDTLWKRVFAPAGHCIAFDGSCIFHRAEPPVCTPRFSLTLTYCTRHPLQLKRPVRLPRALQRAVSAGMSDRQRATIPYRFG